MKLPESFPFERQAGGIVFRVYSAPLSKSAKDGTSTDYSSFLVKYYQGGQLLQKRRKTWDDVETFVEEVVSAMQKNDPERLELSGRDRRIYLAATEALQPLGCEVDQAAREYADAAKILADHKLGVTQAAQMVADALRRLGDISLSTAIDFYLRHGALMKGTRTTPQVVDELLKGLEKDGRGKYHIRDMRLRLGRFASTFPGPIHQLQERDITEWLQNLRKTVWQRAEEKADGDGKMKKIKAKRIEHPEGEPVGKRTRNNYRDAINELFEFAKRRGYVPKDLPTAAEDTARVKVVAGKNHIISPEEATRALESLPPHLVPFTVLKLFSGLRTEEAYGLCWDELRFKSKAVIIEAKLAKLRQRRVPPILPNLAKWLCPFRDCKGPINPRYSSPHAVMKAVTRESKKVNVNLHRNTYRNCYISYRVAHPQPSAIVAAETGTSVRMVESNYKALATEDEAKRWFSIRPTKSQVAKLKAFVETL